MHVDRIYLFFFFPKLYAIFRTYFSYRVWNNISFFLLWFDGVEAQQRL